jgi:hypothetical protein
MIIGNKFAWGHLPKTGGDATLTLFQLFPELIVYADGMRSNAKHSTFAARDSDIKGKLLFLNIRKLPFWMLSRTKHRSRYGTYPDYQPRPMLSAAEMAKSNAADQVMSQFLGGGRYEVDRWIRAEYLKEDFLSCLEDLTDIPEDKRQKVRRVPMVNAMRYDHDISQWFTQNQIQSMYDNNPLWASLEQKVYSDREASNENSHQHPISEIRKLVRTLLSPEAIVAVVSGGDEELLDLDVRRAWHLPQGEDGAYTGSHPADDHEAIGHLEHACARGADFLLLPDASLWWFERYPIFRSHLESRYRRMWRDETCLIYQLSSAEPGSGVLDA